MKTRFTFLTFYFFIFSMSSQIVNTFSMGNPDDAIAIDSNDNIYVSGFSTGKIFKFTPTGNMTEFATGLSNPNGLYFDSLDNLYLCQWSGNMISRYFIDGSLDTSFFLSGNPSGIIKAFDNDDIIFTRYSGNTIQRMSPSGSLTDISNAPELNGPVGLAYDENGILYVGNYNNREIYRVLSNGNLEYVATVGNSSNLGFITYAQGKLWGTVLGEHKIYFIDPNEIDNVTVFAGSVQGAANGSLNRATFNTPNGIRFSNDETTMYISEFNTKNLRIISNISLSIDEYQIDNHIKIITNHNDNSFLITGTLLFSGIYKIDIYNILGQKVEEIIRNIHQPFIREIIKTAQWKSGIYIIKISSNEFSETKKVIIN